MKRRLVCLALCLAMLLLPVLSGCNRNKKSVEETVSDAASESAVTLTMWMVSEDPVDVETVSAINQAVNAITKTKFKTRVIVKFYTEEEYRDVLDDTIISYLDTRSSGLTYEDHSIIEDDSEDGEKYGINIIKYPDPLLNQVDIVYISGKDMYVEYIENGWLSALDSAWKFSKSSGVMVLVLTVGLFRRLRTGRSHLLPLCSGVTIMGSSSRGMASGFRMMR